MLTCSCTRRAEAKARCLVHPNLLRLPSCVPELLLWGVLHSADLPTALEREGMYLQLSSGVANRAWETADRPSTP